MEGGNLDSGEGRCAVIEVKCDEGRLIVRIQEKERKGKRGKEFLHFSDFTPFPLTGLKMKSLPVLYQDDYLIAVNKPAGLLMHRTVIDRHETEFALQLVRNQSGRRVYPFHRLDKATSGVLLFAFDPETGRRMTALFSENAVKKSYIAVVRGFTEESGRIDHALKERTDRFMQGGQDKAAQEAITEYRRLATIEIPEPVGRYQTGRFSLIKADPRTGRNHQIRRHMKHIFHPVIGDTTYGDGRQNEFFRRKVLCRRLLLHAQAVTFVHPHTGEMIRPEAPLDDEFRKLLDLPGWSPGSFFER
jgi:tRNA pseudouridine65 synthase